jgi:hypothetical protein
MSKNKSASSNNLIPVITALIGVVGTIAVAYFAFRGAVAPKELEISATQTAESIKATQTSAALSAIPTLIPNGTSTESFLPPSPTAEPVSQALYDNFEIDGPYDPNKWFMNSTGGDIIQQGGALSVRLDNLKGTVVSLQALNYKEFSIESPMFFEANLMLPAQSGGHLYMLVIADLESQPYSDCTVYGFDLAVFSCGYDNKNIEYMFEGDDLIKRNYGTWHTMRIEIVPASMEISHYIDGEKIRNFVPPGRDELQSAKFTFEIGFAADDPDATGVGYIDYVRIGIIE